MSNVDTNVNYTPRPPGFDPSSYLDSQGMSSTSDLRKTIEESYERQKGAAEKAQEANQLSINQQIEIKNREIAEANANVKRIQQLNAQAPTAPKPPTLPAAPQDQFQNPFQAFQNPAVFIALLGSLATRAPLTAAFKAGAAAMEGFHKGDQEQIELNYKNWKNNVDQALKTNDMEMQAYRAAMEKHEGNWRALQAEMQAVASGFKNETALSLLKSQGPKDWYEYVEKMETSHLKAAESVVKIDNMYEQQKLRAAQEKRAEAQAQLAQKQLELVSGGGQGEDTFNDRGLQLRVDRALTGEPMTTVTAGLGQGLVGFANRKKFDALLAKTAEEQGITAEDLKERRARWAGDIARGQTAGRFSARVDAATEELAALVPQAIEASRGLPRGPFVPLNKVLQSFEAGTSDEAYNDFAVANYALLNAYVRAMNPTGNPRVAERLETHAIGLLSLATSQRAYEVQVNRIIKEVQASRGAINAVRSNTPIELKPVAPPDKAKKPSSEPDEEGWRQLAPGVRFREMQ